MLEKKVLTALFCLGLSCSYVHAEDEKPAEIVESATYVLSIDDIGEFENALKQKKAVISFYKTRKLRDIHRGLEQYAKLNPEHKCFECVDEDVKKSAGVDSTCVVVYKDGKEVERHKTGGMVARGKLYVKKIVIREQ